MCGFFCACRHLGRTPSRLDALQDILMSAFKALDAEGRGYIESERMRELLCGMGTPAFREKEFEAFLKAAGDRTDSTKIYYEDYCAIMTR